MLVVNGDDFGRSADINEAIIYCAQRGVLTSATLMMNMPEASDAATKAARLPTLGVGVHLTMTLGSPLSSPADVPDLIGTDGRFLPLAVARRRLLVPAAGLVEQIRLEWGAQVARARLLGLSPTHVDSHHGVHKLPAAFAALRRVVRDYGIPAVRANASYHWSAAGAPLFDRLNVHAANLSRFHRLALARVNRTLCAIWDIACVDQYLNVALHRPHDTNPVRHMCQAIASLPPGVTEMAFHPSFASDDLGRRCPNADLRLLTAPEVRAALDRHGVQLSSYVALRRGSSR